MAMHFSLLAGESHRQGSLVGYSPWGRKESDTTERLSTRACMGVHGCWGLKNQRIKQICLRCSEPSVVADVSG